MKNKINLGLVICLVYVIVYIVLKIWNKPNFDFFTNHDMVLPPSFDTAIANKRKEMLDQMKAQNVQDEQIRSLKSKIDTLRNDLQIIKSKEQDELSTIYQQVNGSDSMAEALGVDGGKELGRMLGGNGKGSKKGKNYNLNFNLDDE